MRIWDGLKDLIYKPTIRTAIVAYLLQQPVEIFWHRVGHEFNFQRETTH